MTQQIVHLPAGTSIGGWLWVRPLLSPIASLIVSIARTGVGGMAPSPWYSRWQVGLESVESGFQEVEVAMAVSLILSLISFSFLALSSLLLETLKAVSGRITLRSVGYPFLVFGAWV